MSVHLFSVTGIANYKNFMKKIEQKKERLAPLKASDAAAA